MEASLIRMSVAIAAEVQALKPIHVHAARPAGINSPTEAAILGTQRIVELVKGCGARDRVICLLSGGGSALLVAPAEGVTLADKQAVAQQIAAAGGNIEQLNAVRRPLSLVKGGGLARACHAAQMLTLIISDVLGDSLQTIASGPTVLQLAKDPENDSFRSQSLAHSPTHTANFDLDTRIQATRALAVLDELGLSNSPALAGAVQVLKRQQSQTQSFPNQSNLQSVVDNIILGNNADAVDAAGVKAVELGYRYVMQSARGVEGDVLQVAHHATDAIVQLASQTQIDCWISGGEPTVRLPNSTGQGGRNQQLTLAVMRELQLRRSQMSQREGAADSIPEVVFLSGGTDGEDGPTNAAGAFFDDGVIARAADLRLDAEGYLARADAYSFFQQAGGLLLTGPTGTNVCDLRVALCKQR